MSEEPATWRCKECGATWLVSMEDPWCLRCEALRPADERSLTMERDAIYFSHTNRPHGAYQMNATEMKVIAEARRRNAAMSLSQAREWVRGLSADALSLYAAAWGVL